MNSNDLKCARWSMLSDVVKMAYANNKKVPDRIPGGPGSGTKEKDYNAGELLVGTKDETEEHTDAATAKDYAFGEEIAADHLKKKNPHYYSDEMSKKEYKSTKQSIDSDRTADYLNKLKNRVEKKKTGAYIE